MSFTSWQTFRWVKGCRSEPKLWLRCWVSNPASSDLHLVSLLFLRILTPKHGKHRLKKIAFEGSQSFVNLLLVCFLILHWKSLFLCPGCCHLCQILIKYKLVSLGHCWISDQNWSVCMFLMRLLQKRELGESNENPFESILRQQVRKWIILTNETCVTASPKCTLVISG